MSSLKKTSARVAYADWVRVLAAAMVVMIHTAAPLFNLTVVGSADFLVAGLFDGITHAAVPLFVMVSGVFMLDESRPLSIRRAVGRYALPLVGLYAFWSVVYALANKIVEPLLLGGAVLNSGMLKEFAVAIVEGAYHLWYLPMMVTVYLLCPLLRRFVSRENPRPARYFVLVAGVLNFLLPTGIGLTKHIVGVDFTEAYATFSVPMLVYPAYFVAGWLIANCRPSRARRLAVYAGGGVALAAMLALSWWLSLKNGEAFAPLMEPTSVLCAVYAVALFSVFSWEGRHWRAPKWLGALSGLTFGVYILHVEVQALYKVFLPFEGGALGYMLTQWAAVTAVSLAATWVVLRIPLLKRSLRG